MVKYYEAKCSGLGFFVIFYLNYMLQFREINTIDKFYLIKYYLYKILNNINSIIKSMYFVYFSITR